MKTRAITPDPSARPSPVIACLDRSHHAAGVLAHAVAMAEAFDAPLRVVQAIEPPTEAENRPDPLDWAIRRIEAREALKNVVVTIVGPDRAAAIDVSLLHGRAGGEIRRECRRQGAGLVVMGMHGEHAAGPPNGLGTTAREVLENGAGMVLIATGTANDLRRCCRHILVPLDGSAWSETALPVAMRIARATGAGITLAQVVAAPDPAGAMPPEREDIDLRTRLVDRDARVAGAHLEQLRRALLDQGIAARALTLRGDGVRAALSSLLGEETFDLVVMSACGHGGARSPDHRCGGVAGHLAAHSPVPVLIMKLSAAQGMRASDDASTGMPGRMPVPPAEIHLAAAMAGTNR